jgi:hypothetical protein
MAITRAQQVRQMLQDGGRIGFKGGADAATASFGASVGYSDPETGSTGRDDPDDGFDLGGGQGPTFDGAEATIVTGDDFRKAQEAMGKSKLKSLYRTGVPKSNLPGLLGLGLNATKKLRDFTLRKNIEYFEDLSTSKYPKTLEGYTQYMQDRSAGLIDAAGNPKTRFDDNDSFIPVDTTSAQSSTEEVLSPIQQAILDRGAPSAFLATGGRVAFRGGDAAKSDAASGRNAGRADPSGGVERPGGGGGNDNNRPPPVKKTIPPEIKNAINLGGDISYLKNLIELNPVGIMKNIGGKLIMDKIFGDQTSLDTEDENMKMAELSQTQLDFLNSPKIQRDLKEFGREPKAVFDMLPDYEERRPTLFNPLKKQEPTTTDEFNQYLDSISVPRMQAAEGGIMDLETGRQMYFLGKLVKKATRAVKKVVKSPIGKAALIAGLGYYAGGGGNPFTAAGRGKFSFENIFSKKNPLLFSKNDDGEQVFSPFKASSLFALSPLLLEEDTNEDEYQKFLRERGAGAQLPAPIPTIRDKYKDYLARGFLADGGTPEPVAKKTMPLLDMDGKEMDLRAEGGFVPIGRMEKADDVPARLSKNEFVFTADAVRNAGDGDVDKGAEVMYNMMKNLESGGDVSEESQGLEGARRMFQTSQRLEEVL